ncbi:putative phospholipase [Hyphodiscus hymeniophilus]|uniref:Phospholipase n=1 Tax=Hyphodiscus hymeniophilus TaxID=353542 RepID=A0A9P7B0N7_9HELO|nr:putative phospholipase [Hyphodiscus hymeniophilus]
MGRAGATIEVPVVNRQTSSLDKASQLVGKLNSDGIANLHEDTTYVPPTNPRAPRSLKAALEAVTDSGRSTNGSDTASETASEEDYDAMKHEPSAVVAGGRGGGFSHGPKTAETQTSYEELKPSSKKSRPGAPRLKSISVTLNKLKENGRYVLTADDNALREILKEKNPAAQKRRSKFSDLVFTRQFTAFDRNNTDSADSPFHGFFTLFWLGVAIFMMKIAAENYSKHGNPFGTNEIMGLMFHRDVMVLGLSDGVMCAATAFGLILQKLIHRGWLSWNKTGWIVQSVWEFIYIVAVLEWTLFREWPWTHTVFFVIHGLVMLMKQHSYAFYNGHLSEDYKNRKTLLRKLKQLEDIEAVQSPSATSPRTATLSTSYLDSKPTASDLNQRRQSRRTSFDEGASNLAQIAQAIESGEPLDVDQIQTFERIIKWEVDALTIDLKGKSTTSGNIYPTNLNIANHYEYIVLPTLVYELEYPRSDEINWYYVAEKLIAVFGVLGVMNMVGQSLIYPVVVRTIQMKDAGMTLQQRLEEFPWILSDLIFPFMMEYMMVRHTPVARPSSANKTYQSWYVIWECILNLLAELTYFADRGFYGDWWNSISWDQFARDWNRPVHNFLLRHVYHSSISSMKVNKYTATLITFFLSAMLYKPSKILPSNTPKLLKLANFLQKLAQQAKNVPKYIPEHLFPSSAWTNNRGVAGRFDRRAEEMDSTPVLSETNKSDEKKGQEKGYLSAAVDSIYPWGASSSSTSRSSTPKPRDASKDTLPPGEGSGLKNQHGGRNADHGWKGLSRRRYPSDCPELNARWFYAVDIPKRKPKLLKGTQEDAKPLPPPKKFVTFSEHDSSAVETAFQKLADEYDDPSREQSNEDDIGLSRSASNAGKKANTSMNEATLDANAGGKVQVPVHEDFLFDVDVERRELSPVYWLGPIYEVRRGSWFYQEGSTLRPCDENLASQLEEGYLKIKPFRYPKTPEKSLPKSGEGKSLALSGAFGSRSRSGSGEVTPKASMENLRAANQQALDDATAALKDTPPPIPHQPQTHRLFGTYMNSIVTYQDATVAWLSADSIMSRVSSTVYQKFAGGGYLGGVKIVRGFLESGKAKDTEKTPPTPTSAAARPPNLPPTLQLDERQQKLLKRRSAPPSTKSAEKPESEATSMLHVDIDAYSEAEAVRKRDEKEIQNDYKDREGENQGREIEHLILVTHGIGQRLGMRTESVNFIHDVNVLRQTLKSVYSGSADLQALNSEIDKLPKNCRVQVLPVCWRHLLDFPRKGVRQNRKEHDLGEAFGDEEEYPSLEDITVEGVPFVRSLITDLALDILLYQSAYREHIVNIVLDESNRIYNLFRERNPYFQGKVSLIGHSLGSAILFDILCRQKEDTKIHGSEAHRKHYHKRHVTPTHSSGVKDLSFDFNVEDFYCLGSPIGLFQMLKGRTIAGRHQPDALPAESPMDPEYMQDPFLAASSTGFSGENVSSTTGLPFTISSPKCAQLYNIFHPTDPISYRLEPLIAPAMSSMKPQALPYTKKGISASVSGLGATIGQSVSGLWSSLSSGIASSLLNRSLGLTNDDVASMATPTPQIRNVPPSVGAGTNISAGGVVSDIPSLQRENTNEKKRQLAEDTAAADRDGTGANAPTLIDDEIETLFAGFQKRRKSHQIDISATENEEWAEAEERGRKLRREEMKVRALNQNGRVDFSIQESVLDFNPINTIASHLSYWADEDVSHFMMSQLLSRHRTFAQGDKRAQK